MFDDFHMSEALDHTNLQELPKGITETFLFAWEHPDDWWNSKDILAYPETAAKLLENTCTSNLLEKDRAQVHEMLYNGTRLGVRFDLPLTQRKPGGWNHTWPNQGNDQGTCSAICKRRLMLAGLQLHDAEAAAYFVDTRVIAFHVTGALALEGIIEKGLASREQLIDSASRIFTGEQVDWTDGISRVISCVEWDVAFGAPLKTYGSFFGKKRLEDMREDIDVIESNNYPFAQRKLAARRMATLAIEKGQLTDFEKDALERPYEVMIGIAAKSFDRLGRTEISSDIEGEIALSNGPLTVNEIPLILVPGSKVDTVSRLLSLKHNGAVPKVGNIALYARFLSQ